MGYIATYRDFRLELLHLVHELLRQLSDLLVVADVTQTQLIRVFRLQLIHSRLQLVNHRILPRHTPIMTVNSNKGPRSKVTDSYRALVAVW